MEEIEALKEAEETALKQAELAAEEAAKGLLDDIDLDDVSLHTNDDDHVETPSTRSLRYSVPNLKSPFQKFKSNFLPFQSR